MGNDDAGAVRGDGHLTQEVHHAATRRGIERGGGLIADHQPRLMHQRAGNRDALLLTARKLVGQFGRLIGNVEFGEHCHRAIACFLAIHPLRDQRDGGVAGRVDRRDEVILLEDEADVIQSEFDQLCVFERIDVRAEDLHLARGRPENAAHDRDQRGFARAAFADEISQLAGEYVEVDAVQDGNRLLACLEVACNAAGADRSVAVAVGHQAGFDQFAAHLNTDAGSVLRTLRSASQPVSARIRATAMRLISGTCQGM